MNGFQSLLLDGRIKKLVAFLKLILWIFRIINISFRWMKLLFEENKYRWLKIEHPQHSLGRYMYEIFF